MHASRAGKAEMMHALGAGKLFMVQALRGADTLKGAPPAGAQAGRYRERSGRDRCPLERRVSLCGTADTPKGAPLFGAQAGRCRWLVVCTRTVAVLGTARSRSAAARHVRSAGRLRDEQSASGPDPRSLHAATPAVGARSGSGSPRWGAATQQDGAPASEPSRARADVVTCSLLMRGADCIVPPTPLMRPVRETSCASARVKPLVREINVDKHAIAFRSHKSSGNRRGGRRLADAAGAAARQGRGAGETRAVATRLRPAAMTACRGQIGADKRGLCG